MALSNPQASGSAPPMGVGPFVFLENTMADIPQPPNVGAKILNESEPLKAYHGLLAPFHDQIRDALGSLTLKDNLGAVVTDPAPFTADTDGALTGAIIPASFAPLEVRFRAEELDAAKRPTGIFTGGGAVWSTSPRTGEQGVQVVRAPGLTSGKTYSVTFVALPG